MIPVSALSNENMNKRATIIFALLNYMLLFLFIFSRNAEAQQGQSWEIPKNLIPVRYTLTLITFLEENNFNFTGDVIIEVRSGCF